MHRVWQVLFGTKCIGFRRSRFKALVAYVDSEFCLVGDGMNIIFFFGGGGLTKCKCVAQMGSRGRAV